MQQSPITEFLTNNGVQWFPIILEQTVTDTMQYGEPKVSKDLAPVDHQLYHHTKTKDDSTYVSKLPEMTDFDNCTPQDIIKRQNLLLTPAWKKRFNYIAMRTDTLMHIDLDCPEYSQVYKDLLETKPYFKSATKSYGKHILITSDSVSPAKRTDLINDAIKGKPDIELLAGQWSYCKIDATVYNSDCADLNFDFAPYLAKKAAAKPTMPVINTVVSTDDMNRELLELIRIQPKDRKAWQSICDAMKSNGFSEMEWLSFCISNGLNMDKEKIELYSKARGDKEIYLIYKYAKETNADEYKRILQKYNYNTKGPQYQTYLDASEIKTGVLSVEELMLTTKYQRMKATFEESHFKLECPIRYIKIDDRKEIHFYSESDMGEYLTGKKGYDMLDGGKLPFWAIWRQDTDKRVYSDIVFQTNPAKLGPTSYNSFTGFENNCGDVPKLVECESKFLEVLRRITVKPEIYDYIVSWFAHIIQTPFVKTNTAIILYSATKGVGKNAIIDGFTHIIGEKYVGVLEDIDDLTKNFNSHLSNKLIVYGDEISFNAKKLSDRLKAVITRPYLNLEKKGVDAIKVEDKTNYIFTTNNEHCFKSETGDRRLYMANCIEEKLPKKLSKELYAEISDPIKLKQLFQFFNSYQQEETSYEIGITAPPQTEYKLSLQYEDTPAYIQMLYKCVGILCNSKIGSTELHQMAVDYAKKNHQSANFTMKRFGLVMNKYLGDIKRRTKTGYAFVFGTISDIRRTLFKADPDYYRYVYSLEQDETPTFEEGDEPIFNA